MGINYYKINETLNHRYYQIPQELFFSSLYKDKLDLASKILYGFILDRLSLSAKNNWCDKDGNIYLIFTREEAGEKLNLSPKTITKAFKQLSDINLIEEKRQGFGKPNLIFVGKIHHEEISKFINTKNLSYKSGKNYVSRTVKNSSLDMENLPPINTNNINTKNKNAYLSNNTKRIYSDVFLDTLYANSSMKNALTSS